MLLLTVAVKFDPMLHPPIVPLKAVKIPLFTENNPLLAEILPLVVTLPVNVPLAALISPLNVPEPLIARVPVVPLVKYSNNFVVPSVP